MAAKRVISKQVHFVELLADGSARHAGYAPYLDYRAATEPEQTAIRSYMNTQAWLTSGVEDRARGYAIAQIIPQHFAQVRQHKQQMLDKITKAVKERLTAEIQYWDFRAADLKQKEAAVRSMPGSIPKWLPVAPKTWPPGCRDVWTSWIRNG